MEGLVVPSKLYAALAAGRPLAVICEPHSYLRQLITEAKCGAAFNNEDANGLANFIQSLAASPHLVTRMGRAGRHYLESNFTPEIIARQYSAILCQAVREIMEPDASTEVKPLRWYNSSQSSKKRTGGVVRVSKHRQD
jgi:glycosyltransferase involved in cell wall biosynthesis